MLFDDSDEVVIDEGAASVDCSAESHFSVFGEEGPIAM